MVNVKAFYKTVSRHASHLQILTHTRLTGESLVEVLQAHMLA